METSAFLIFGVLVPTSPAVPAALPTGCDTLHSGNMQHGLLLEGRLRIADPRIRQMS